MKYLCLKCKLEFDDNSAIPGITSSGRRRLSCPVCGSRKYKYQSKGDTLERKAAYAREYYRKQKSTPAGRAYLVTKRVKYLAERNKGIKGWRRADKRTIRKEGFTAHDLQEMSAEKWVKNWPKIVGAEK